MKQRGERMCACSRRQFVAVAGGGLAAFLGRSALAAQSGDFAFFIKEAARMKEVAIESGDQPYGAVIVRGGAIIGYGPSRVVLDGDIDAHAERVALWDAQRRLGSKDLPGCVIYSTSHPCSICEAALAAANVERMFFGPGGTDGGEPRRQ